MEMFKSGLRILSLIVGAVLVVQAGYHGIWQHDYPQACFDLLLALMIKD